MLLGTQWKSDLDKCKCIFIRVPSYNRHVIISTGSGSATQNVAPFNKDDPRLRHIPFMTFRPTFNEVKRAHTLLAKIELYGKLSLFKNRFIIRLFLISGLLPIDPAYLTVVSKFICQKSPPTEPQTVAKKTNEKKSKPNAKSKSDSNIKTESKEVVKQATDSEPDTRESTLGTDESAGPECKTTQNDFIQSLNGDELKTFNEIYTACFTNNVTKLKDLLGDETADETKSKTIEKLLNKRLTKEKGYTILHLTSELGHAECVWWLLMRGADPALSDLTKQRRLPYFVATSKPTRDHYRRFMNDFPLRYDYRAARIDSPLTQDQMNEKAEKEREKKRNQRKQKKQRDVQTKQQEKQHDLEAAERQRFLSLTDQEKRRLIIDRNFLNVVPLNCNDETTTDKSKVKFSPSEIKIISRCWTCAADMSTAVPFEYFDYKFCSTKCLKVHRENQKQSTASK